MQAALSVALWVPAAAAKVALALAGVVVVPLCFWRGWDLPKIYRGTPGRPHTVWELTFRNMVDGWKWYFRQPPADRQIRAGSHPGHLESQPLVDHGRRFGWQWRRAGLRSMVRLLWIYPGGRHYGELFIGWKLGYQEINDELDFALQPRVWATVGN